MVKNQVQGAGSKLQASKSKARKPASQNLRQKGSQPLKPGVQGSKKAPVLAASRSRPLLSETGVLESRSQDAVNKDIPNVKRLKPVQESKLDAAGLLDTDDDVVSQMQLCERLAKSRHDGIEIPTAGFDERRSLSSPPPNLLGNLPPQVSTPFNKRLVSSTPDPERLMEIEQDEAISSRVPAHEFPPPSSPQMVPERDTVDGDDPRLTLSGIGKFLEQQKKNQLVWQQQLEQLQRGDSSTKSEAQSASAFYQWLGLQSSTKSNLDSNPVDGPDVIGAPFNYGFPKAEWVEENVTSRQFPISQNETEKQSHNPDNAPNGDLDQPVPYTTYGASSCRQEKWEDVLLQGSDLMGATANRNPNQLPNVREGAFQKFSAMPSVSSKDSNFYDKYASSKPPSSTNPNPGTKTLPHQEAGRLRSEPSSLPSKPIKSESSSFPSKQLKSDSSSLPYKPSNSEPSSLLSKQLKSKSSSLPSKQLKSESSSLPSKQLKSESSSLPSKPLKSESSSLPSKPLKSDSSYLSLPSSLLSSKPGPSVKALAFRSKAKTVANAPKDNSSKVKKKQEKHPCLDERGVDVPPLETRVGKVLSPSAENVYGLSDNKRSDFDDVNVSISTCSEEVNTLLSSEESEQRNSQRHQAPSVHAASVNKDSPKEIGVRVIGASQKELGSSDKLAVLDLLSEVGDDSNLGNEVHVTGKNDDTSPQTLEDMRGKSDGKEKDVEESTDKKMSFPEQTIASSSFVPMTDEIKELSGNNVQSLEVENLDDEKDEENNVNQNHHDEGRRYRANRHNMDLRYLDKMADPTLRNIACRLALKATTLRDREIRSLIDSMIFHTDATLAHEDTRFHSTQIYFAEENNKLKKRVHTINKQLEAKERLERQADNYMGISNTDVMHLERKNLYLRQEKDRLDQQVTNLLEEKAKWLITQQDLVKTISLKDHEILKLEEKHQEEKKALHQSLDQATQNSQGIHFKLSVADREIANLETRMKSKERDVCDLKDRLKEMERELANEVDVARKKDEEMARLQDLVDTLKMGVDEVLKAYETSSRGKDEPEEQRKGMNFLRQMVEEPSRPFDSTSLSIPLSPREERQHSRGHQHHRKHQSRSAHDRELPSRWSGSEEFLDSSLLPVERKAKARPPGSSSDGSSLTLQALQEHNRRYSPVDRTLWRSLETQPVMPAIGGDEPYYSDSEVHVLNARGRRLRRHEDVQSQHPDYLGHRQRQSFSLSPERQNGRSGRRRRSLSRGGVDKSDGDEIHDKNRIGRESRTRDSSSRTRKRSLSRGEMDRSDGDEIRDQNRISRESRRRDSSSRTRKRSLSRGEMDRSERDEIRDKNRISRESRTRDSSSGTRKRSLSRGEMDRSDGDEVSGQTRTGRRGETSRKQAEEVFTSTRKSQNADHQMGLDPGRVGFESSELTSLPLRSDTSVNEPEKSRYPMTDYYRQYSDGVSPDKVTAFPMNSRQYWREEEGPDGAETHPHNGAASFGKSSLRRSEKRNRHRQPPTENETPGSSLTSLSIPERFLSDDDRHETRVSSTDDETDPSTKKFTLSSDGIHFRSLGRGDELVPSSTTSNLLSLSYPGHKDTKSRKAVHSSTEPTISLMSASLPISPVRLRDENSDRRRLPDFHRSSGDSSQTEPKFYVERSSRQREVFQDQRGHQLDGSSRGRQRVYYSGQDPSQFSQTGKRTVTFHQDPLESPQTPPAHSFRSDFLNYQMSIPPQSSPVNTSDISISRRATRDSQSLQRSFFQGTELSASLSSISDQDVRREAFDNSNNNTALEDESFGTGIASLDAKIARLQDKINHTKAVFS